MTTLPDLRAALAELGIALLVLRVGPDSITADGLGDVGGLLPIAIVWDADPETVRARVREAIGRLGEQFTMAAGVVAQAS